jgi:hypothetical protein
MTKDEKKIFRTARRVLEMAPASLREAGKSFRRGVGQFPAGMDRAAAAVACDIVRSAAARRRFLQRDAVGVPVRKQTKPPALNPEPVSSRKTSPALNPEPEPVSSR